MDNEQLELLKQMRDAANQLASYTSYAEIIGAVKHNQSSIRKWCDKVYEIERTLKQLEDIKEYE